MARSWITSAGMRLIAVIFVTTPLLTLTFTTPTIAAHPARHGAYTMAHRPAGTGVPVRCKHRNAATGTVRYADWQWPGVLDPYQNGASVVGETLDNLFEGLVLINNKGHAQPDLLARLPSSPDNGRTYNTTLKQGLRWSDGREVTAADVKFGWEIMMHPDSGPFCPGIGCDNIKSIDTVGTYGLVFHMKSAYAPFILNTLPYMYAWPTSWPHAWNTGDVKAAADKLFQDAKFNFENASYPTDGAYQVAQYVTNDRMMFHPMPYYGTMTCGARVQNLLFVFYSSKADMIAAAATRQVDNTTDYSVADLPELNQHGAAFKTYATPAFLTDRMYFNQDATYNGHPNPLHDTRVRLALALALDKIGAIQSSLGVSRKQAEQLVAWTPVVVTKALVQPYGDTKITGQWDPLAKQYIADTGTGRALADARTLLVQAGYGNGFDLDGLTFSGAPDYVALYSVMQANWARIGVRFHPRYMPASALFTDYASGSPLYTGKYQVFISALGLPPDPAAYSAQFETQFIDRIKKIHSAIDVNFAGIHDPVIDEAFTHASHTLDAAARQQWYNRWQEETNKKAYWVPMYYDFDIATTDGRVGNWSTNPTDAVEEWDSFAWYVR